jgi:glyoxylase-like metal-dependent hydrolase (beta-lactamase superfamily II)
MQSLRDDVQVIPVLPRFGINAYLLGDVLVDSGVARSRDKVLAALAGRPVSAHALTHAHYDHAGSSNTISERLGVPVWVGRDDAEAAESGRPVVADTRLKPLLSRGGTWEGVRVARRLLEGDEVGPGFVVLDTPGHSPGHISFWRPTDRTLICGDVFFNLSLKTMRYRLAPPPGPFTIDPALNRDAMRRLAALEPDVIGFGHGEPLHNAAPKLRALVAQR